MSFTPNHPSDSLVQANHAGLQRLLRHNDALLAIGVAAVLTTLLIPLPTFLLDMLLAVSIAVALSTLVVVLSMRESIEFSTFPSLLLFVTLFRLSLNVASTRLILLNGNAGRIIETFGHFVVGGNIIIGLVVFLILVIIQFIVITKGAERISEVAARFNLDAMPGKQMAIDADLNAGLIGEQEAKQRREKIVAESEFYGAMDGSSKFIRGDAIAGLVITAVNLVGGFVVGMTRGMSAGESVSAYAILAVGDGLVTQIPAVIISTSAGFLISKASTESSLSVDLARQFLARSRPITLAAFLFAAMLFVPGFPKLPFIMLAVGAGLLGRKLRALEGEAKSRQAKADKQADKPEEGPVEELLDVDRIAIHVGPRLIKTVDPRRKDSLSHRIEPLRRKFAEQYGFILPLVRLRDSVTLDATRYEIRINNHIVADGQLEPDGYLAMDPGTVTNPVDGRQTTEPVFNLPALWINADQKEEAELAGYTVVEPESVLVTHLSETIKRHAGELLTRDDVRQLVDRLRETQPALVNGTVGESVSIGLLQRVCQRLLNDGIGIRDLPQIIEALADNVGRTKDPQMLTELARKALVRTITEQHAEPSGTMRAIVFDPSLEYELCSSINAGDGGESLDIAPERAMELVRRIADAWRGAMSQGHDRTVLLCDYRTRAHLAGLLERQIPELSVLAYDEIAIGTNVDTIATVSLDCDEATAAPELEAAGT
ncbi:MAG: flagellar biosynthesis protein FlhA [Phycisphaerae bacterium]|nr:flagellar biosynthesis protein FlhA [Phycisphaerae bacterium]